MSYNKKIYGIAAVTAAVFVISFPALAQTVNNLTVSQPPALPSSDATEPEPHAEQPATGEPTQLVHKQSTTTHKAAKHKTKKTKHKAATHKKVAKKKTAAHKTKKAATHKKKPAPKPPAKETRRSAPAPVVAKKATQKPAPDASMAAMEKGVTTSPSRSAGPGPSKTVAYNFCLGYDNCVPHRYETTVQGNKTYGGIVMQKDANGKWTEGKLDPSIMADLDHMAQAETETNVERDLTPAEKSEIAGHQGKIHAMLVSYIQAGVEKKEEIKNMLRQLKIRTLADLESYDPRLAKHDVAVQAVNEVSVGR